MDDRYLDHCYEVAGRRIDPVVGRLSQHGTHSTLGRKQLEVLAMLASAAGKMVPREDFIEEVWDGDALVGQRGLTDTVYSLRRLLEGSSSKGSLIRTYARRGYELKADVRLLADDRGTSLSEGWILPGRADWRLKRLLSQNDVSETWLGEQSSSGERRVFRFCRSEAHLQRLRREIVVLRFLREKLADRSDVLSIIDWRLDEPPYFLETDYAEHGSLADWAHARGGPGQIALGERIERMAQAASALAAVHAAGVVHRNISPAGILIDRHGEQAVAKLGEFGLGELTDRSRLAAMDISSAGLTSSADGSARGSCYLAPEDELGEAADVYAMGVVLYQLVVGDLRAEPVDSRIEAIELPALRELIADCVRPRPERRPTARDLCRRLEGLDLEKGEAAPAESRPSRSEPPRHVTGPSSPAAVGETIGPFRLLDRLGEGGMGVVYLAEQRAPVERKVALKLIRAGMDSQQVLARFEAERQALALMGHANVAAVYDAGCSDSGHPYFAMEYVPGLEITAHCDRSRLGVHARVELFLQVCDGVQHAHQKGLIHRDLKPSNLLVKSPSGQPATVKIIDFGVAKSLQRRLSASTVHTRLGTFVGTPSYSSPEQISGHQVDVDTRADVYSLGVVLYELLTGVTPYSPKELAGKSPLELVEHLNTSEPPTPLARFLDLTPEDEEAIAAKRSQSVEHLKQRLGTDVAWIILRCLERDPEDRYGSVLELKKDLLRWLEDRPIEARPAGRAYRLRKLVKRHRTAVALAALTTLALLASTAMAVFGLVRAEQEAARAQAAALEAEKAAEFQVELLQSFEPSTMGLGFRSSLREAVAEQARQRGGSATEEEQRQLDQLLQGVNFTDLTLDQLDEYFLDPALEKIDANYQDFPLLQTRLWQAMSEVLMNWGHYDRAVEPQDLAIEGRRALLGAEDPRTLTSLSARGSLRMRLGLLDEAVADLEAAATGLRASSGRRDPATITATADLGFVLLLKGDFQNSETYLRQSLELVGDDYADTANLFNRMGTLLQRQGRYAEAENYYRQALDRHLRTLGSEDPNTIASMNNLANVLVSQEKLDEAETHYRAVVEGSRRLLGEEHPATLVYTSNLAGLLVRAGRSDEAKPIYKGNLEAARRMLGDEHPNTLHLMHAYARLCHSGGQLAEAESLFREALNGRRRVLGDEHRSTLATISRLAGVLGERGSLEEAVELSREALEGRRRVLGEHAEGTLETQQMLASLLREQGQPGEAAELEQAIRDSKASASGDE